MEDGFGSFYASYIGKNNCIFMLLIAQYTHAVNGLFSIAQVVHGGELMLVDQKKTQ